LYYEFLVTVMCDDESALQVFEPFGQVELVQLPMDPLTGLCKGYGFIQVSYSEQIPSLTLTVNCSLLSLFIALCSLLGLKMQRLHRV
jgi:hypothetical protein